MPVKPPQERASLKLARWAACLVTFVRQVERQPGKAALHETLRMSLHLWQNLRHCGLQALQARHRWWRQRRTQADEDGPRLCF